jgi:hypothetical protein
VALESRLQLGGTLCKLAACGTFDVAHHRSLFTVTPAHQHAGTRGSILRTLAHNIVTACQLGSSLSALMDGMSRIGITPARPAACFVYWQHSTLMMAAHSGISHSTLQRSFQPRQLHLHFMGMPGNSALRLHRYSIVRPAACP